MMASFDFGTDPARAGKNLRSMVIKHKSYEHFYSNTIFNKSFFLKSNKILSEFDILNSFDGQKLPYLHL